MKTRSVAPILFLALIGCFLLQPAYAQSGHEGGGLGVIITNPNAPGTKLFGTLTLYYTGGLNDDGLIYYFMRLQKGNSSYGFAGSFTGSWQDVEGTQAALTSEVASYVLPSIYGGASPPFELKGVSDEVIPTDETGPIFYMADITLAVKD